MNARLRARHRATFVLLGLALPPFGWMVLAARPPAPVSPVPSDGQGASAFETLCLHLDDRGIWMEGAAHDPLRSMEAQHRHLLVVVGEDWNEPDLLLYWSRTQPSGGDLPPEAILIGAVGSAPEAALPLPVDAADGWFSVYSLARRELLGSEHPGFLVYDPNVY